MVVLVHVDCCVQQPRFTSVQNDWLLKYSSCLLCYMDAPAADARRGACNGCVQTRLHVGARAACAWSCACDGCMQCAAAACAWSCACTRCMQCAAAAVLVHGGGGAAGACTLHNALANVLVGCRRTGHPRKTAPQNQQVLQGCCSERVHCTMPLLCIQG